MSYLEELGEVGADCDRLGEDQTCEFKNKKKENLVKLKATGRRPKPDIRGKLRRLLLQ
jgi:hypothetical protein